MTDLDAAAQPGGPLPRGLIVVLAGTGLLVSVLALRQFASLIGPVLLALILVIDVHPLTGVPARRGAPMWLAVTSAVIALVDVILGLAASLALSVAQLFDEQWASGCRIIPTTRSSSSRRSPTVHSV